MSTEVEYMAGQAHEAALEFIAAVQDATPWIAVGGSIRRKFLSEPSAAPTRAHATVHDIEIVAIATPELLARIDSLVGSGLEKRLHLRMGKEQAHWGQKHRKAIWRGIPLDLFLTTWEMRGYMYWLRTGPGDANEWIMGYLSNLRQRGAKIWTLAESVMTMPDGSHPVAPTEFEMFRLLGMPYIEPHLRTLAAYRDYFESRAYRRVWYRQIMKTPLAKLQTQRRWQGRKVDVSFTYGKDAKGKDAKHTETRQAERVEHLLPYLKHLYFDPALWTNAEVPIAYGTYLYEQEIKYRHRYERWLSDYRGEVAMVEAHGQTARFPCNAQGYHAGLYFEKEAEDT